MPAHRSRAAIGSQRTSSAGRRRLRCIHDYTASCVNLATSVDRRLILRSVADLVEASVLLADGKPLAELRLLKSDFHSAYK